MAAASSSSEIITNDGPVLNLINKRLRALRKKLNRISQMEDSVSQGKILNKEQEETLRSKSTVLGAVDELEKLRQPLMQSVSQEIELALEKKQQKPNAVQPTETTKVESAAAVSAAVEAGSKSEVVDGAAVSDLLNLLYLASVFDVQTLLRAHDNMVTRMHERACCLTYDYVGDDDAAGDPLKEWDLDLIAMLGGLLVSRPVNSSSSHKNALQKCVEHAKLWLANADQPIEPESNITYAGLREKLNKIMASDYFITTPEMKAPVEVAAAGGNYTSFQVPVQGAMVPPVSMTVPVEGSAVEYQQEEEQSPDSHNTGNYVDENGHVEEHNQGAQEVENTSENPPQTEQAIPDAELDQHSREFDSKEQHPTRKSYQNYRGNGRGGAGGGGGRRGYGNSRGGGRGGNRGGNQFYDQAGGYYGQRSGYNYRGRGGRGGMGGGSYGYHHGPAGQAQEAS